MCWSTTSAGRFGSDQAVPPVFRRGSETGARTIIVPDALVLLGGVAHYDQADVRLDCKSRLAVDPRPIPRPLRSQQRWHIGVEQGAGNGIWPLWHPDQHEVARR